MVFLSILYSFTNLGLTLIRSFLQAIDAFEMLADHGISGLAVTDEAGKLTAALSAKDLRCVLRMGDTACLGKPLLQVAYI